MGDLAFIFAGCGALAAITLIIVRLGAVRANTDWIFAWVALLAAGVDLVLVPASSWLNVVSPLYDHLFATFLLSGTLRFAALERHLARLWVVSLLVCLLRLTIQPFMPLITGAASATLVICVCSIVSCWLLFNYARQHALVSTRVMSFAFLAPAGVQVYFLVTRLQGDVMSSALFAYVVMGSMLGMAQLTLLLERARRETERNRETLALMAQTAPVGLCLTGQNGNLEAINPVAQRLLNISESSTLCLPDFLAAMQGNESVNHQPAFAMQVADKIVQVQRQPIPVANQHAGDIWFLEDISARVQLNELIPRTENLETVRNIAANIAHVFNNKLTVIMGNADLLGLKYDAANDPDVSDYLAALRDAVDECSQLTHDFLLLTQQEAIECLPLDLEGAIRELNEATDMEVVTQVAPLVLSVDAVAFSRAFEELLRNAEEAGASRVTIVSEEVEEGYARLALRDNGKGLDVRTSARVFEPFFSTKEQPLGSGLGLSVVDSIVRAHGGTTKLSALSEGTEISTTWPLSP